MSPSAAIQRETLASRLQQARDASFVGRTKEQALWSQALSADSTDFAIIWLVGPGGVGKTALLRRFGMLASAQGVRPTHVDARHVICPDSFEAAVASALGADDDDPWPMLNDGARRALLIDTAEELGALERFLCERFLPALPVGCPVVLAGRTPPGPELAHDPGWSALIRVVALHNLAWEEAEALLNARGIDNTLHGPLLRCTQGHPLALSLLADVIAQEGALDPSIALESPDVIGALLARFSHGAPDACHRAALQVAAHARITDEALLRHAVDPDKAAALYDWLASLSFSILGHEGLYLHDLAARALDVAFRRRDPQGYQAMHRKVREPCVIGMRTGCGVAQLRAAADVAWMNRFTPVVGGLIDWAGAQSIFPDFLRPADHAHIVENTTRLEGPRAGQAVMFWLSNKPEAFTVIRTDAGHARGYLCQLVLTRDELSDGAMAEADPRVAAALQYFEAQGSLRDGERMTLELTLDYELHQRPGPMSSQVLIRRLGLWLGPNAVTLSVIALGADVAQTWEPLLQHLEHAPGPIVNFDHKRQALFVHDWRVAPPERFLERMEQREVLGADAAPAPVPEAQPTAILSEKAFAEAVRDALRVFTRDDALSCNSLMETRAVRHVPSGEDPHPLRRALLLALASLETSGKDERAYAALKLTYIDPARTQEEAAELLGMSFSTYRRQLAAGVERMQRFLWQRELNGY